MPITVNGVGTSYFGKSNKVAHRGVCRQCGRETTLASYDTMHCFVILFIPIIPLGRKRILDYCSSCRRHYIVPLHKYHVVRDLDYSEANALLAKPEATVDDVLQAFGKTVGYGEPAVIADIVRKAEAIQPNSATVHRHIAEIHRLMNQTAASEQSLKRALELADVPETREALAQTQIAQGNLDAGKETLAPMLQGTNVVPTNALQQTLQGLQKQGRHAEALELMSRVASDQLTPAGMKHFAKLRASSERTLERSQIDPDKYVVEEDGKVVRRKKVPWQRTRWALMAAAGLAVVYFGASVFLGYSHKAYLVNGTANVYTVRIDGRNYVLQSHEVKPIRVAEGDIQMTIVSPGFAGAPRTFAYSSSFWTRPISREILALNPDGLGEIIGTTVVYSVGGSRPNEDTAQHICEVGYAIPAADYVFENPPASMRLKDGDDVKYRAVLAQPKTEPIDVLSDLVDKKDPRVETFITRMFEWPLEDSSIAHQILALVPEKSREALMKPRLSVRPVEVESHRLYQEMARAARPLADIQREYREMLKEEPANAQLQYLLARILDDNEAEALKLFASAQSGNSPEPMAFFGQSVHDQMIGNRESALTLIRQFRKLQPTRELGAYEEWLVLMGLGRYQEALSTLPPFREDERTDVFERRLATMAALNRMIEIDSVAQRRMGKVSALAEAPLAEKMNAKTRGLLAYLRHDMRGFAATITDEDTPADRFAAAISRHDITAAEKLLPELQDFTGLSHMLLYIACGLENDTARGPKYLRETIAVLRASNDPSNLQLATWLAGDQAVTTERLTSWLVEPMEKAIAAAAIGTAQPQYRVECAKATIQFDNRLVYPHELITQWRIKLH